MKVYYDANGLADDSMISEAIFEAAHAVRGYGMKALKRTESDEFTFDKFVDGLGWSEEFEDDLEQLDYTECEEV